MRDKQPERKKTLALHFTDAEKKKVIAASGVGREKRRERPS